MHCPSNMDMQDFRRALDAVPPEQREAHMLVAAAGFSYEEAAAIVGCAIGTIKSRVHRARWKLMEVLEMDAPRKFGPDHAPSAVNLWRMDEEELATRNPGPLRLIEASCDFTGRRESARSLSGSLQKRHHR